jgi:hypothetical protein
MTDAIVDNEIENCDDEGCGPSMALPPLYVLRAVAYCPQCRRPIHVYTLGCAAFHDAGDNRPVDDFHFLRQISSVPQALLKLLKDKCPGYYLDQEDSYDRPYLMNHCQCGAKLDDDYVSGDVGAAFWPDTPEGYEELKLFKLPIDEAIAIQSSWSLGGGEYLTLDKARPWTAQLPP